MIELLRRLAACPSTFTDSLGHRHRCELARWHKSNLHFDNIGRLTSEYQWTDEAAMRHP